MKTLLTKTVSLSSIAPIAFGSLCELGARLGWQGHSSKTDRNAFEFQIPVEDANIWDFIMDGLA